MKKVEFSGEVARTPVDVYAALTSPEFWRDYAVANKLAAPQVETVDEGGVTVTRSTMTVPVSGQAAALAGNSADISTVTRWTTSTAGDVRVDVAAKQKADVTGTIRLESAGAGTRLTFAGELHVRVAFLGGVAEGQAVKYVPEAFENLASRLTAWQI